MRFVALLAAVAIAIAPAVSFAQSAVGNATKVVRDVTGTLSGASRPLAIKSDVFANEKIATAPNSATEVTFADGTKLSLGPDADVTLDSFVYNSGTNTGQLALNIAKGTMRFVTGKMASPSYQLRTPQATIGIRGTILTVSVLNGLTTVIVEQGLVAVGGLAGAAQAVAAGQSSTVPAGGAASAPGTAPADAVASVNNMDATLARAPGAVADGGEAGALGLTNVQLGLAGAAAIGLGLGIILLNNDGGDDNTPGTSTSGTTSGTN